MIFPKIKYICEGQKNHIKHKTDTQFEEMDYLKTAEQQLKNETEAKQNVE